METFLLTYQSFTTAHELLHKLIERYHIPWSSATSWKDFEGARNISQIRVCNLFLTWTKRFTSDFIWKNSEDEVVDKAATRMSVASTIGGHQSSKKKVEDAMRRGFVVDLMTFVENILAQDHPKMARQIRRNIVRLLDEKSKKTAFSTFRILHPEDIMPESREAIMTYPCEEIARHLTHIEFVLFRQVLPPEFLNQSWTKPDADIKARHIFAITKRFNSVACWICKTIVEIKDVKGRAKVIAKFIDIANVSVAMTFHF
jgi:son of sevenless-like protein